MKKRDKEPSDSQAFAFDRLDRVMHEKARLGIMTSLLSHAEGLVFNDLKRLCGLTDGNLSRHLQTLEQAELVSVWKGYQGRRPQTLCRLTPAGRKRFLAYIAELEKVVAAAAAASGEHRSTALGVPDHRPALT